MKSDEIREMTIPEIVERIEHEKEMLLKLKINHHVSSLENPMKIKYSRRTIARLKTEVNKRKNDEVVSDGNVEDNTKTKVIEKTESVEKEEQVTSE